MDRPREGLLPVPTKIRRRIHLLLRQLPRLPKIVDNPKPERFTDEAIEADM